MSPSVWLVLSGNDDHDDVIMQGACLSKEAAEKFAFSVRRHIARMHAIDPTWVHEVFQSREWWTCGRYWVRVEEIEVVEP